MVGARILIAASTVVKISEWKQCAPAECTEAVNAMWCTGRDPDYALLDGPLAEYLWGSASD